MNFIPDTKGEAADVPYFEDATGKDGWQGHTSSKSIERLQSEITEALTRLGGRVTGFMPGTFETGKRKRFGFRVSYIILPGGEVMHGEIDIAALPLRSFSPNKKVQTQRMALFMFRNALEGAWFMQQLSPGYAPLMPFMLTESGKTITQLWSEGSIIGNLLPPGDAEFVEGEYKEV